MYPEPRTSTSTHRTPELQQSSRSLPPWLGPMCRRIPADSTRLDTRCVLQTMDLESTTSPDHPTNIRCPPPGQRTPHLCSNRSHGRRRSGSPARICAGTLLHTYTNHRWRTTVVVATLGKEVPHAIRILICGFRRMCKRLCTRNCKLIEPLHPPMISPILCPKV
jgi:hypothetical protein